MRGSVSAKMQQLEMSHTHCAEAQEVDSPESFLSSLQEALGESISSAKSFTCWLSWSSTLQLQGSHLRRCVTLIAWVPQLSMGLRFRARPASGTQPWDSQDQG